MPRLLTSQLLITSQTNQSSPSREARLPEQSQSQIIKAANPKIGAAVGTTSLDAVENVLGLKPQVFNDNAAGVAALKNGQIDGFVVDLPTAFYLSAAEVENGIIVGQLENSSSADEGAGLLLAKDSPVTVCVTNALEAVRS